MIDEQLSLVPKREPEAMIGEAVEAYQPVRSYCLFSGGHDSTVLAHRCRDAYDTLAHIDTGTAVPGVREYVAEFAEWLGKPLEVFEAGDAFRRMVVGDATWWARYDRAREDDPGLTIEAHEAALQARYGHASGEGPGGNLGAFPQGFPAPAQHGRAYSRLKERQIETVIRTAKVGHPRSANVMLLSGKRLAESARRARTTLGVEKRKAQVYVNPLIDWTTADMMRYRREHDLPESPVAALLHRSGECNCGAFAQAGEERAMIAGLWPEWWSRMDALEAEAEALGLRWCRWGGYATDGTRATDKAPERAGILCTDCDLRQFSMEVGA